METFNSRSNLEDISKSICWHFIIEQKYQNKLILKLNSNLVFEVKIWQHLPHSSNNLPESLVVDFLVWETRADVFS